MVSLFFSESAKTTLTYSVFSTSNFINTVISNPGK